MCKIQSCNKNKFRDEKPDQINTDDLNPNCLLETYFYRLHFQFSPIAAKPYCTIFKLYRH